MGWEGGDPSQRGNTCKSVTAGKSLVLSRIERKSIFRHTERKGEVQYKTRPKIGWDKPGTASNKYFFFFGGGCL